MKSYYVTVCLLIGLYTVHVAYATNESSYKFGYDYGKFEYPSCALPADKSNGEEAECAGPVGNCGSDNISEGVTNQTACVDGYVNGWNHVCQPGAKDPEGAHILPCHANKETIMNNY